ncbi:MAG: hypothetical protein D6725_08475 [Planctomycetota bacterium]|nr:MAG: hypothetical protein D6725_08475 [Planctomycetota bacterium]
MAANKPTAVHFALIFFVMAFLIAAVAAYMQTKAIAENEARWEKAQKDAQAAKKAQQDLDDQVQALKRVIGYLSENVGYPNEEDGSVLAQAKADLEKVPNLTEKTYRAAVAQLLTDVQNLQKERDAVNTDKLKEHEELLALRSRHEQVNDQYKQQAQKAEKDLRDLIAKKEEEIRAKETQLRQLRDEYNRVTREMDELVDAHRKEKKRLEQQISFLNRQVDYLRARLDEATKISFEEPDGEITWVDSGTGMVWINLGSADNLPRRMTFSVYRKTHHGVARGKDDIKGAIEVTRIIDAHTAEARIMDNDIYDPIAKGDPIYTPLWNPGQRLRFAVVGLIDLDGDGEYDRQRFHDLLLAAGASLDNEVDDDGNRIRYIHFPDEFVPWDESMPGLDVHTKFLIVGEIPDPSQATRQEDIDRINRIIKHHKQMLEEARMQGTRVVSLSDFLAWMGYRPQRRLYIPGMTQRPYNLKAGAASATVGEAVGNRTSTGTVSGLFTRKRKLRYSPSTGQTSKRYSGGGVP